MRGGGDELPHSRVGEDLRVVLGDLVEVRAVSEALDGLPAAGLIVAQGAETHAGGPEELHQGAGDLLGPPVIGGGATHIVEDLVLGRIEAGHLQVAGPSDAVGGRLEPGIVVPVDRPEHRGEAPGDATGFPSLLPQALEDLGDRHPAGAQGLALSARGAQPQVLIPVQQADLGPAHHGPHGEGLMPNQAPGARCGADPTLIAEGHRPLRLPEQALPQRLVGGQDGHLEHHSPPAVSAGWAARSGAGTASPRSLRT